MKFPVLDLLLGGSLGMAYGRAKGEGGGLMLQTQRAERSHHSQPWKHRNRLRCNLGTNEEIN